MSQIEQRAVHAGLLRLKTSRIGETCMIQLEGELDLANAQALEAELDAGLGDGDGHVIVDMGDLLFIDSTGLALLVAALNRDGDGARLRFVPSRTEAVKRVLELTGIGARLPLIEESAGADAIAASSAVTRPSLG
ncbi:MAG: anti-sigma-factor antagonist [Solirubrobacterales bacterium]|nr:anti-sigma-factor antagonist [Solirubrobacterales bacterium]